MAEVRLGEDDGRPVLLVDGTVQSVLADDPDGYWRQMIPDARPSRALLLGLGAGTVARLLWEKFGDVSVVGVDYNEGVVDFAHEFLRDVSGLEIVQADAFEFTATAAQRGDHFDYIAVDLYEGNQLAHGAVGRPFLRALKTLAGPRGVVVFNLFYEKRLYDRLRRIERVFRVLDRRLVRRNLVVWCRTS